MLPQDIAIIQGLKGNERERRKQQDILYREYEYFIGKGSSRHRLTYEDSFSAYSDALKSLIDNIVNDRFDGHASIKTYFYEIFYHKCIDFVRKNATNKNEVHRAAPLPAELITQLPDNARTIIEGMMTKELKDLVRLKLDELGDKCRQVLEMYEQDLTDKEIAEQLSYNNAAVAKTTRLRCLDKLKSLVLGA